MSGNGYAMYFLTFAVLALDFVLLVSSQPGARYAVFVEYDKMYRDKMENYLPLYLDPVTRYEYEKNVQIHEVKEILRNRIRGNLNNSIIDEAFNEILCLSKMIYENTPIETPRRPKEDMRKNLAIVLHMKFLANYYSLYTRGIVSVIEKVIEQTKNSDDPMRFRFIEEQEKLKTQVQQMYCLLNDFAKIPNFMHLMIALRHTDVLDKLLEESDDDNSDKRSLFTKACLAAKKFFVNPEGSELLITQMENFNNDLIPLITWLLPGCTLPPAACSEIKATRIVKLIERIAEFELFNPNRDKSTSRVSKIIQVLMESDGFNVVIPLGAEILKSNPEKDEPETRILRDAPDSPPDSPPDEAGPSTSSSRN